MWTLRKIKPFDSFPAIVYFWCDGGGIVRFQRTITPLGFMEPSFESVVGEHWHKITGTTRVKSKATQEQLQKGWLVL